MMIFFLLCALKIGTHVYYTAVIKLILWTNKVFLKARQESSGGAKDQAEASNNGV